MPTYKLGFKAGFLGKAFGWVLKLEAGYYCLPQTADVSDIIQIKF